MNDLDILKTCLEDVFGTCVCPVGLITKIRLEITNINLNSNLPGANDLNDCNSKVTCTSEL